jgi:hypothetical protein
VASAATRAAVSGELGVRGREIEEGRELAREKIGQREASWWKSYPPGGASAAACISSGDWSTGEEPPSWLLTRGGRRPGNGLGLWWASVGREEKDRWARNSPVWFRNPFFLWNLFKFCILKTFCKLSCGFEIV